MAEQESLGDAKRFGSFLRKVRERKRLSLDAVEEMSSGYSERLTKSHLSRIENGLAEPSVRKLFALSQIYGMPLTSLAERFELDLQREQLSVDVKGKSGEEIYSIAIGLRDAGRYVEELVTLIAALEEFGEQPADDQGPAWGQRFRVGVCDCLIHLGRYETAKVHAEELLSEPSLPADLRVDTLVCFVICCKKLGRLTVAIMGLEQVERELQSAEKLDRQRAEVAVLKGSVSVGTGDLDAAAESFGIAVRAYEELNAPFQTCRARINMAAVMVEKGEHDAARSQLEAALLVAEASGYDRLRALAMSHLALLAVRRGDLAAAETWAIRSNKIARPREFATLVFRNCYYLMKIAKESGDQTGVRANTRTLRSLLSTVDDNLPESLEFRRDLAGGES